MVRGPMPHLNVRHKDGAAATVRLDRLRMTIGRSIRSDVPLRDPFASRLHAVVQSDGAQVLLVDMGSANGTWLNEHRVAEPRRLHHGDLVRIGDTLLQFLEDERATSLPPAVLLSGGDEDPLPDADTTVVTEGTSTLLSTLAAPLSRRVDPTLPAERDLLGVISKVGVVLLPRTSVTETLHITMQLVFEAIPAERGFLFLREDGQLRCRLAWTREGALDPKTPARLSRSIVSRAFREGSLVLTADAAADPRFAGQRSVQIGAIRSVMAVPLSSGQDAIGVIYVDASIKSRFVESDLTMLATIAAVAAIKIEHEQFRAELVEKRRIQEELKIANEIQMRLLPIAPPRRPGWDLTGVSLPCREIGGDYFDFVQLAPGPAGEERLALALGDVAGKGIGAALLMSSLHAAVRAYASVSASIAELMSKLNEYICENAPSNRFVTLFFGVLDPATGELSYSNAGHNQPILVRADRRVERLVEGGLAVGISPGESYEEARVVLGHGDSLVIFSDGISDSVNPDGEVFGEDRIVDAALAAQGANASALRDRIEESLSLFVGSAAPIDDMTLLIVTRASARAFGGPG